MADSTPKAGETGKPEAGRVGGSSARPPRKQAFLKTHDEGGLLRRQPAAPQPAPASIQEIAAPEAAARRRRVLQLHQANALQRAGDAPAAPEADVGAAIERRRGLGSPLPDATRGPLEESLETDLSDVRVHTDQTSDALNQAVQAKAFTTGSDIFFSSGAYNPGSGDGQKLLAHEATHVRQQRQGPVSATPTDAGVAVSEPGDPFELEAEASAETFVQRMQARSAGSAAEGDAALAHGQPAGRARPATAVLQRSPAPLVIQRHPEGSVPEPASMSVTMDGIVIHAMPGSHYQPGPVGPQMMRLLLKMLVRERYTAGLENEVFAAMQEQHGVSYSSDRVIADGEHLHLSMVSSDAYRAQLLVTMLEEDRRFGHETSLTEAQRELLTLGTMSVRLRVELRQEGIASQLDRRLPDWLLDNEWLFQREMSQQGALLRRYQTIVEGGASYDFSQRLAVFNGIVNAIGPATDVWDAVRADDGYEAMQAAIVNVVQEHPSALSMFLRFVRTQPSLSEQALTEHDARVTLLQRFERFFEGTSGGQGDEQITDTPGRANAEPFPSRLSIHPSVNPPFFLGALGSEYTFSMVLSYSHWTEAFANYAYRWEHFIVPPSEDVEESSGGEEGGADVDIEGGEETALPQPLEDAVAAQEAGQDFIDSGAGGERADRVDVGSARMARSRRYGEADVQRVMDTLGPVGYGVWIPVQVNNMLRNVGTALSNDLETMFRARTDRPFHFAQEGVNVIRCTAYPILEGDEEVIRGRSVAYMIVNVRNPQDITEDNLEMTLHGVSATEQRIDEINRALDDEELSITRRHELQDELQLLERSIGSVQELLAHQLRLAEGRVNRLERELARAEASNDILSRSRLRTELREAERIRDNFRDRYNAARNRAEDEMEGLASQRVFASFVSDTGQQMALELTIADLGADSVRGEHYYVSDTTTPDSGQDDEYGESRAEAIMNALVAILESRSGYGRGTVTAQIDGRPHTRRIEASLGSVAEETFESLSTLVTIAALVAAPFTGGASLYVLIPIGIVGAIPAGYRLYERAEGGTLRADLNAVVDVVSIVTAFAGLGQAVAGRAAQVARAGAAAAETVAGAEMAGARALRYARMERGLAIFGIGGDIGNILLVGGGVVSQISALGALPQGEKTARILEILGRALVNVGLTIGQHLISQAVELRQRELAEARLREAAAAATALTGPAAARRAAPARTGAGTPPARTRRPRPTKGLAAGPATRLRRSPTREARQRARKARQCARKAAPWWIPTRRSRCPVKGGPRRSALPTTRRGGPRNRPVRPPPLKVRPPSCSSPPKQSTAPTASPPRPPPARSSPRWATGRGSCPAMPAKAAPWAKAPSRSWSEPAAAWSATRPRGSKRNTPPSRSPTSAAAASAAISM